MGKRYKNQNKKQRQNCHFKRRFFERVGAPINNGGIECIVQMIRDGNSHFCKKQSNRVVVHKITYNDSSVVVAYDKMRNQPITVFPRESRFYSV
jgi:hypothetical protein